MRSDLQARCGPFTVGTHHSALRSAKPEKLDHLNDPLVPRDAVIEQHRSITEDLDRALIELLTKRVLDGDHLAERLQRGGEVTPAGVRQRGNRSADPSVLTRKGSITPAQADPGQPTHPQATGVPGTRAGGSRRKASQRSAQPGTVRRASTCRYQPCTTPSSPA
jgi:hypothetical protein